MDTLRTRCGGKISEKGNCLEHTQPLFRDNLPHQNKEMSSNLQIDPIWIPPESRQDVEAYFSKWMQPVDPPGPFYIDGWVRMYGFRRGYIIYSLVYHPEKQLYGFDASDWTRKRENPNFGVAPSQHDMWLKVINTYAKAWRL